MKVHGDLSYHEAPSPPSTSLPGSPELFQLREDHLYQELLMAVEGAKYIGEVTGKYEKSDKVCKPLNCCGYTVRIMNITISRI